MKTNLILPAFIALAIASGPGYNYRNQGNDWTGTCADGQKQSPINIPSDPTVVDNHTLEINWKDQEYTDVPRTVPSESSQAQSIQVDVETSTIHITPAGESKSTYVDSQFHIHAPSEHTINGKEYDLEIHFVHQKTGGTDIAVVSILFDVSPPVLDDPTQYFFDDSRFNISDLSSNVATFNPTNALKDILTNNSEFYFYDGSLTTPPCTEGVKWSILKNPLPITPSQLGKITAFFADDFLFAGGFGNNRLLQNLNDRTLLLSTISEKTENPGDVPGGDVPGGDVPGGDVPGGDVPGGNVPGGSNDPSSASFALQFVIYSAGLVLVTLF